MHDRKWKLSDYVLEEIKARIHDGTLREGDRLPNQVELARQLNVSTLSLREALNTLTQMGVIEQRPRTGTVIKSANPGLLADKPEPPMLDDSEATAELLEARVIIETRVAALAARRVGSAELAALSKEIEGMRDCQATRNVAEYMKHDMSFHFIIADASHNRYLIHMFVTIRGLMERFMSAVFKLDPDLLESSFVYHEGIYEALAARDEELATRLVAEHVDHIRGLLRSYYDKPKTETTAAAKSPGEYK